MKILSDNELIFFKQNGYLIVDDIFSKKDLDTIKNIFQDMIFFLIKKAIKSNPDKKILDSVIGNEFSQGLKLLEEIDRKYILEFYDSLSIQNNPYIARLSSNPKVLDIINNLLNKSYKNPLFITSGSCVFAMPNDKLHTPNKWHTDVFYSIKDSEYIQVWAPLIEDTSNELGALHIMPKSHKIPFQGYIRDTSRDDSNIHRYVGSESLLKKYEDKIVKMKLGQVVFFDKHLFHRGGDNITDRVRLSLVGVYHSMENPSFSPYPLNHPKQITSDEYYDEVFNKN